MAGGYEWIIVLLIVVIVFGVGRIGRIGGELGEGIKAFRRGLREGNEDETKEKKEDLLTK